MVRTAQAELGLPQSATVFDINADATGAQMAALANRALDELRRMNRWTAMQFEFNIVVTPSIEVTGDLLTASPSTIANISPNTTGLVANYFQISGSSIPVSARILSVDDATTVTMTMEHTSPDDIIGAEIKFGQDTYAMPSGFDYLNNQTMWDRTNRWNLQGPDSPQTDQWRRSGIVATGPRRNFRQIGPYANTFRIWPAPIEIVTPLQLVFEYLSINAVAVEGSPTEFAQYFTADTDTCLLDDNALIMGIKWMFWEIKGFGSYAALQNRWVDYVDRLAARDGAAPTLRLNKRKSPILISPANIQDGNYPGSV
jgi:hypothetical protein